jgi:hypothetical protein
VPVEEIASLIIAADQLLSLRYQVFEPDARY